MFFINKQEISKEYFNQEINSIQKKKWFSNPRGKRYAICLTEPLHVIAVVYYLREAGASVLLIHGETPKETAIQMAQDANCYGLLYETTEQFLEIDAPINEQLEPSLYQYSSGTTGDAKLISRSWTEIDIEVGAYNKALNDHDTPIILASITHSYGLICGFLSAIKRDVSPVIVTNKNPKYILSMIGDIPNHIVYTVPFMLQILIGFTQETNQMNKVMTSGAPISKELYEKLREMNVQVMQQYGCSEVGCISLTKRINSHLDVGKPLEHLKLIGGNEQEPSEIIVHMNGKDIYTRDLGFKSKDGDLCLVSRMDDVINVAGLKVYPLEVEEIIAGLEGIREVVVYRGIHPVMGEIVKSVFVADGSIQQSVIREWCMKWLPPYKIPSVFQQVIEIPKNPNGKISRKLLQEREQK